MKTQSYRQYVHQLHQVLGSLQADVPPPLVLIWGPDPCLIFRATEAVRQVWREKTGAFPASTDAREIPHCDAFLGLWQQGGLFDFAAHPLRILHRLELQKSLFPFWGELKNFSQSTVCATLCGDKLPPPLEKSLIRLRAVILPCLPLHRQGLQDFAADCAKQEGLRLHPDAWGPFLDCCGDDDLFRLHNGIRKLALIFAERAPADQPPVTWSEVQPYLDDLSQDHVYKLFDLLLGQEHGPVQLFTQQLLARGETAPALVGLIARHLRNALAVLEGASAGTRPLPVFVQRQYGSYARSLGLAGVLEGLLACYQAEVALKTSNALNPELILAELLEKLLCRELGR